MSGRRRLGCAALVGAAVAFPAGMIAGGNWPKREAPAPESRNAAAATRAGEARDYYSPNFRKDPYVIAQKQRVVEALELACRQYGERCPEARAARRRIEEMR